MCTMGTIVSSSPHAHGAEAASERCARIQRARTWPSSEPDHARPHHALIIALIITLTIALIIVLTIALIIVLIVLRQADAPRVSKLSMRTSPRGGCSPVPHWRNRPRGGSMRRMRLTKMVQRI